MNPRVFLCFCLAALQQLCCQALTWSEADPALTDGISPHYPWRMHQAGAGGLRRMKRAWVIPPISVSENVKQIPKLLVQINSDKQKLGSVIYSIKGPGVDEEPRGFFNINTTTGAIYLNAMLDREEHDIFKLTAFALDLHGKPLEEPTNLTIVVVDQNDNRPVFKNINITGHVLEGSTPGTYVTKAEATDADDPQTDNGALRYSIIEQDSPQMFSIDKDTGVIRTVQVGLDREIVDRYNLTIQVGDMSGIGLTTSATAVIYVGDINDNPPEFTQQKFVMEVMEQTVDVDIGRVSVQDKDLRGSPNWLAKYIILLNTDPLGDFAIRTDPVTNDGILSVVKPLDHEAQEQVELTIMVLNENDLSRFAPKTTRSLATVLVKVRDMNEPPFFRENPKVVSIKEGSMAGSEITRYTATDPDIKQPQTLSYKIEQDPAEWLIVDRDSGAIHAKKDIDRKSPFLQGSWYKALIIASDNADPPRTATGTLSIEILEVNDSPPHLFPLVGLVCSTPRKDSGVVMSAIDQDLPPQAEPFDFQLDPASTELSQNWTISRINDTHAVLQLLKELEEGLYVLPVWTSDSGKPPLAQVQLLNVTVCNCDAAGSCRPGMAAIFIAGAGISFGALMIILASIMLLLLVVLFLIIFERYRQRSDHKGLLAESEDDIRDNVFNYDEQGGGEQDQDAYDINQLRNPNKFLPPPSPRGKQPIRKDAPYNYGTPQYPRKPLGGPSDIEDFINDGLDVADNDPSVPPYDTALIYDYEGEGSVAGSLSSILSGTSDSDQEYDYLNDWGPRFKRLADMYGQP
ncbi:cadherin-15 [Ambystoma mexicanum]|uniref:cadherin-15 n=1 Tax=Ambystoma mexicanum TaxID=8296 RepID=UPI0037E7A4A2